MPYREFSRLWRRSRGAVSPGVSRATDSQPVTRQPAGLRSGFGLFGLVDNDTRAARGGTASCTAAGGTACARSNKQLNAPIQNLDIEVKGNRFQVVFHLQSSSFL
jgi:hypothetical protein